MKYNTTKYQMVKTYSDVWIFLVQNSLHSDGNPQWQVQDTCQMAYILILESDLTQLSLTTGTVSMLGLYFHHNFIPNLKKKKSIKATLLRNLHQILSNSKSRIYLFSFYMANGLPGRKNKQTNKKHRGKYWKIPAFQ